MQLFYWILKIRIFSVDTSIFIFLYMCNLFLPFDGPKPPKILNKSS